MSSSPDLSPDRSPDRSFDLPAALPDPPFELPAGKCLLGVQLPDACMVYRVVSELAQVAVGDQLVVQVTDGEVIATVRHVFQLPAAPYPGPIRKIVRKLNDKDLRFLVWRAEQETKAHRLCRERIRELHLPMKLSKVVYPLGGGKAIIYFTSEARIDFRDLVRVLSAELRVRVEMRHVGVRDESKLLCGLGPCGKNLCCSEFLTRFHPVSVRMAKNQDLSLTPEGISGACGRLMCCLAYENDAYLALRKNLPKVKAKVTLKDGREGVVKALYPLLNRVEVWFGEGVSEQFDADKLAGDGVVSAGEGAGSEAGGELEQETGAMPASGAVAAPAVTPAPERCRRAAVGQRGGAAGGGAAKGQPSAAGARRGGGDKEKPAVVSVVAAPVVALEEEKAAESPGEGGEATGNKRSSARRRRRGNRATGGGAGGTSGETGATAPLQGAAAPVAERDAAAPDGNGAEESQAAARPAGSGRRRRRRSSARRGGEGSGGSGGAGEGGGGA
ncbi:MAG: hypothetical protein HQL91_04305 [Magnetococcales bacterium]|nr:hypothetical protein [Magnetococcales bacterium]